MPEHRHVLKTRSGITITATLDLDTFQIRCEWNPNTPTRKQLKRILSEYIPWRDSIFEAGAQAKKICILMVTPGLDGVPITQVYGKEFQKLPAVMSEA